jgi:hypothetical protein
MRLLIRNIAIAVVATTIASPAIAQKTITKPGDTLTATATIQQIDLARRYVLLREEDGSEVGVFAPPEFERLKELKAGDTVTITYYESIVYRLRRARSPRPPVSEETAAIESTSALPGATFSHQLTERVTVTATDRDAPSITVIGRDGRTVSRHVDNASDLAGVKPGHHIDITYTEALLVTVARAK